MDDPEHADEPDASETPAPGAAAAFDWWFRSRRTGRIVIAQMPNVALGIVLVAAVGRRAFHPAGTASTTLAVVATIALAWWAGDEILRGVNPWRRTLGIVVLAAVVSRLVTALT
ncbi:MAG: conserved rane protein of unknown function [Acidimicrobiales bacterium]|nr:conserved rane protein of unknown function [Acidimicrobiales bacterium]